jgi:tRNA A-37 threonylcarbamoyl transferase component Bud32
MKTLGNGASGAVYLVKNRANQRFAMKCVKVNPTNLEQQQHFLREIEIMAHVTHPALLRLIGFTLPQPRDGVASIVTEYMPRGSLSDLIQLERNGEAPADWTPTRKVIVVLGIAGAMYHLHSKKIMHRDLKTENILLTPDLQPRIGDFGISKLAVQTNDRQNLLMTGRIGTPLYMAPELFGDEPYSFEVDVYAFGMVVYEILSPVAPFPDVSNPMALGIKITQGERPPITPEIPTAFGQLIERCWAGEPSSRPSFEEIIELLSSDEFQLPGADDGEVREYRARVLPARNGRLERQQAELQQLQVDHRAAVDGLLREIAALQDDNCKLCTLYRKLSSKAQLIERDIAQHDRDLAELGERFEQATKEMAELSAEYDGPFGAELGVNIARAQAALVGLGRRSAGPSGARVTAGLFAGAAQKLGTRDLCGAGFVAITGSSRGAEDVANLPKVTNASWDGVWRAADGGCLEFDFLGSAITLTGYAIRVAPTPDGSCLRSWAVQGFNDDGWAEIDRKEGDEQIAPEKAWVTFPCRRGRGDFTKIRIVQMGPASGGEGAGFGLTNVEFFGVFKNGDRK